MLETQVVYKDFQFDAFYHVGHKSFGIEVVDIPKGKQVAYETGFKTMEEAVFRFKAYGYCNVQRYIGDDP